MHAAAEVETEIASIGRFRVISYRTEVDELEHLAFVKGQPNGETPVLGRVQQENVLGDVFSCGMTESRQRIEFSLQKMEEAGCGVLVYLQKPAPRLENEVRALAGQAPKRPAIERGSIGLPKDLREYGIGAQILPRLARKLRLISNSPGRIKGIWGGLTVVDHVPIPESAS